MSWQNIATQVTLCNFGTTGATYAAAAAWGSAYTGQIWGTLGFGAVSAALAAASAANGCYTPPPEEPSGSEGICCSVHGNAGADVVQIRKSNGDILTNGNWPRSWRYLYSVRNTGNRWPGSNTAYEFEFILSKDGITKERVIARNVPNDMTDKCWALWDPDGNCLESGTGEPGPVEPDPPDPVPVVDPDTGCEWNVTMADSYLNERGNLVVLYKATSNDPDTCGPPLYWWDETGKDPRIVQPYPDPPEPPYPPVPPPEPLPCCDDLKDLLEEIKDCACSSNEQPLEGDYRTITFISDENSPEGKSRLSKRFRYRSSSGIGLSGVVEHWRSFTWAAGPVCVSHKGSTLGAPQVWAATAEEGKRVIRHAAGEAGVDADQVGRWLVSGSTDPRYGMPGTMRVNTKGGFYWITSRLGPDQRPLVQET